MNAENQLRTLWAILTVGLLCLPVEVSADLRSEAETIVKSVRETVQPLLGHEKAAGDLKETAKKLQEKAREFQAAVQSGGTSKKSRDAFWTLMRTRRELSAYLSVSPLRKNAEISKRMDTLDKHLDAAREAY